MSAYRTSLAAETELLARHKQQQSFEFAVKHFFFDASLLGRGSGSSESRNEVYDVSVLQSALYFEERVSLGWPHIFNLLFQSLECFNYRCALPSPAFFRWESLCRQGLESLCTPFLFSSLLSWLQSPKYNLLGRNTCSGPWPGNWAPQQMPSSSYVNESRQTPALWAVSYCALAPDWSKWEMTKHPFWKWLHCHRTSLHPGILGRRHHGTPAPTDDTGAAHREPTSQVYLRL